MAPREDLVKVIAGCLLALAVPTPSPVLAQTPDSSAAAAAATATAAPAPTPPAVQRWGDSVTLRSNGLSLRLPADGVRWRENRVTQNGQTKYILVGSVQGEDEVKLEFWMNPEGSTCESWVATMRGRMARWRSTGVYNRPERILESPPYLPNAPGWSSVVWEGNTCRDVANAPLIVGVSDFETLTGRRAEVVRTMLWYLGEAAQRRQT